MEMLWVLSNINALKIVTNIFLGYRHLRHIPVRAMMSAGTSPRNWFPDRTAVRLFLGQAFGRRASGESSPLLSGNVI